jgi:PAS domain S-box-containing protein
MEKTPTYEELKQRIMELEQEVLERRRAEEALTKSREDFERGFDEHASELLRANERLEEMVGECRQAEEALRESEERFRDLYDNAPIAFFSVDAVDGAILRCNTAALRLTGYDEKSMMRMNIFDLYADTPHGISKAKAIFRRFREGESISDVELQIRRRDGQHIWISLWVEPMRDPNGKVIRSRSVMSDISARKFAEEALQEAQRHLERKVEKRTAEISETNLRLRQEIEERRQAEEALQGSETELHRLSSELLNVQEEERKRVALELHDGIGQSLSAIKYKAETALREIGGQDRGSVVKSLEPIVPIVQEAIDEVRRLSRNLRPSILDDLGISATVSWFCREFETIYSAIGIEKLIHIEEKDVPDSLKIVIFRILQEALNNIAKHSQASLVRVSIKATDGRIEMVIDDNGLGFDVEEALSGEKHERGIGLASMRERTELAGGSFSIMSRKDAGTTLIPQVSLPINPQENTVSRLKI